MTHRLLSGTLYAEWRNLSCRNGVDVMSGWAMRHTHVLTELGTDVAWPEDAVTHWRHGSLSVWLLDASSVWIGCCWI